MSIASSNDSDLDLLTAYEPVVRFTEGELFFPTSVEEYADGSPRGAPDRSRGRKARDRSPGCSTRIHA